MNRSAPGLVFGILAICVAMATGCTSPKPQVATPPPPPPPAVTSETSSQPAPAETTSSSVVQAPAGDPGIVTIDKTWTDDGTNVTTTLQQAGTKWVPVIWLYPDKSTVFKSMIGLRVTSDASKSNYLGAVANGSRFKIAAANGSTGQCFDFDSTTSPVVPEILAAIGGDVGYTINYSANTGEGWVVCYSQDEPSQLAGAYTVTYSRLSGKLTDGTVIPKFTLDIPVPA